MTRTTAEYIVSALDAYRGGLNQTEIARAAGFNSPNLLSMVKAGKAKMPLRRVRGLCRVLGIDPEELILLVLGEEHSDTETNPVWIAFGGRMPSAEELRSLAG